MTMTTSNRISGTSGGAPMPARPGPPWMISFREAPRDTPAISPALPWIRQAMSMSRARLLIFGPTKAGPFVKVLYVAGITTSSAGTHWIVRKNPGGTGTWATYDDYQYAAGGWSSPNAMAADASGNLFVGGGGSDQGVDHWLIKRY